MSSSIALIAQMGLRRSATAGAPFRASTAFATSFDPLAVQRRWKSHDAGDVIGIDLGTTNSCVAVMVRSRKTKVQ